MLRRNNPMVAKRHIPEEPPNVQELLGLEPIRWSDSYEMYGERYSHVTDAFDLSRYENYSKFKARCKVCSGFTEQFKSSSDAVHAHFIHCSKTHGYIFPEDYDKKLFKVSDRKLQDLIMLCMDYQLPLPEYDFHTFCVKQYVAGKELCVVHEGNEYGSKDWIGYY